MDIWEWPTPTLSQVAVESKVTATGLKQSAGQAAMQDKAGPTSAVKQWDPLVNNPEHPEIS